MDLIEALTIDIHRLGSLSEEGVIRCGERYIALTGTDRPPCQCEMKLGHEDFLRQLHCLRYSKLVSQEEVAAALRKLGEHAAEVLPDLPSKSAGEPLQIDLVLGAAELWAFPFEACTLDGSAAFVDRDHPLILTRRIRLGFAAEKSPWPVRPRVLFLHAPATGDLPDSLILDHVTALEHALMPWSPKGKPHSDGLLQVELALGTGDVKKAMNKAREAGSPFTHVHLLAHGKGIRDRVTDSIRWGLRLGNENRDASDPEELADALQPQNGLPVVVTVAACDAANQAQTAIPKKSFAQELHRKGVPVVVASQLPLTTNGSVTMTRAFYGPLLRGQDARLALHEARLELHDEQNAGHDWVSMVGYVQLPEGYADHLMEVGVKREMELLRAARRKMDDLDEVQAEPSEEAEQILDEIEKEVAGHIVSLESRLNAIPGEKKDLRSECHGILASAHKRLAELLFHRAKRADKVQDAQQKDEYENASRVNLGASLDGYRNAFHANIQQHWLGAQKLSLEGVLSGEIQAADWHTTFYAAELALAQSEEEYWAYGTLAELWLLAPMLDQPRNLERAKQALDSLKERSDETGDANAIPSTRDQLNRYVSWWTSDRGFFGNRDDLAEDANELLQHLKNN